MTNHFSGKSLPWTECKGKKMTQEDDLPSQKVSNMLQEEQKAITNSSRKNEMAGPKEKWCSVVVALKYCISDSFVDYEGYSISSKGFLPTVSELNSPILVHFISLIPKMFVHSCRLLFDHFQFTSVHFRFLCNIVLYSIWFYFHHQSHP